MSRKENIILAFKSIWNYFVYLIFMGILVFSALLVSGNISFSKDFGSTTISVNKQVLSGVTLWDFESLSWTNYQFTIVKASQNAGSVWDWISFLSILSTLLAAFFIYSSRKIDNDLKKIEEKYQSVNNDLKEKMDMIENETRHYGIIGKANMYLSTKRFDEAISLLKEKIEWSEEVAMPKIYLYALYKTLADIYWVQWELATENDPSSDNQDYYFNAIQNQELAMQINKWKDDDELLVSYKDKYEAVKQLELE